MTPATCIVALLLTLTVVVRPTQAAEQDARTQLLFLHNAVHVELAGDTLTMTGASPTVFFFSDRPKRIVGHLTLPEFLQVWHEGKDSFAKDPPNAALSILHEGKVIEVILELMNPRLAGNTLTYDVRVLKDKAVELTNPHMQGEALTYDIRNLQPEDTVMGTAGALFIDLLGGGGVLGGAGRGAALGAVGGAIGGNTGKGAAIGAAVGGAAGLMQRNRAAAYGW